MNKSDEIDFLLILEQHGWSTCWIVADEKPVELCITHVFNDPYDDLIGALLRVMRKEPLVTFFWYGEPGGERIEIERNPDQQRMLKVRIDGFYESFGEEIKDFEPTIHFEMKESQFLAQFYYQLKKIETLLKEPSFAKDRGGEFPFRRFRAFEEEVKNYLQLV
jgi:hypothetical protein